MYTNMYLYTEVKGSLFYHKTFPKLPCSDLTRGTVLPDELSVHRTSGWTLMTAMSPLGRFLKLRNVREVEATLGYQWIDHTFHDGNHDKNQDGVDRL